MRLVVYPNIYRILYIAKVVIAGFLNHQQYDQPIENPRKFDQIISLRRYGKMYHSKMCVCRIVFSNIYIYILVGGFNPSAKY